MTKYQMILVMIRISKIKKFLPKLIPFMILIPKKPKLSKQPQYQRKIFKINKFLKTKEMRAMNFTPKQ